MKFDVVIEEDRDGLLHYDIIIPKNKDSEHIIPDTKPGDTQSHQERNALIADNVTPNFDDVQDGYVLNLFLYDKNGNPISDDEDGKGEKPSAMLNEKGKFVVLNFNDPSNSGASGKVLVMLNELMLEGLTSNESYGYLPLKRKYGTLYELFFKQFSPSELAKLPERSWVLTSEVWDLLNANFSKELQALHLTAQVL